MKLGNHICEVLGIRRWPTKPDAKRAAKKAKPIDPGSGKVYLCEHCRGWHYEGSR